MINNFFFHLQSFCEVFLYWFVIHTSSTSNNIFSRCCHQYSRIADVLGLLVLSQVFRCHSRHCHFFSYPDAMNFAGRIAASILFHWWNTPFLPNFVISAILEFPHSSFFLLHQSPFLPCFFSPTLIPLYLFCLHFHLPQSLSWNLIFLLARCTVCLLCAISSLHNSEDLKCFTTDSSNCWPKTCWLKN